MGRTPKKIDWKLVDKLLISGCNGTEIAPHFDMHYQTFYDRVSQEYSIPFTEYQQLKRAHGHSLLRDKQFEKAMDGDNTMLIWLGKHRLDQIEKTISDQHLSIQINTSPYFESDDTNQSDTAA